MNNFDMLITSHKELMMLEVQKIDMMKRHLEILEKCGKEDEPLMLLGATMYRAMYENEKKVLEGMKNTLQNYITMKKSHEE